MNATDALPPTNASPYATWNATGIRIWDCKNGSLVNPAQVNGRANFTSMDGAWTGGFIYINDVARFDVTNKENATYTFDLDSKPGLTPVNGTLPNARWTVNWVGAGPAGLNAGEQYLVRTNSVGGVTPAICPSPKSNRIEVPYTTTCKFFEQCFYFTVGFPLVHFYFILFLEERNFQRQPSFKSFSLNLILNVYFLSLPDVLYNCDKDATPSSSAISRTFGTATAVVVAVAATAAFF